MNLDDKVNYAVEPFIPNEKFLMETSAYPNHSDSVKSEQKSGETWPIQSSLPQFDMGSGNLRCTQPVQHFNITTSIQQSPQKITKRRQRQRRRRGVEKGEKKSLCYERFQK